MTNSTPPDPSQPPQPESPQPRRPAVTFDELVAIIVAFTAIGAILFFSWGRRTPLLEPGVVPAEPRGEANEVDIPGIFGLEDEESPSESESGEFGLSEEEETPSGESPLESPRGAFESLENGDRPLPFTPLPLTPETPAVPQASPTPSPEAELAPSEPTEETPEPAADSETSVIPTEEAPEPTEDSETSAAIPFNDISEDYWAYPFIAPLVEEELLVGLSDNQFEPDESVTREQLAAQLDEAFRQEADQDFINFTDISQGSPTAQRIDEAVETGFLRGYPNQTFRPDQLVPRVQVLVALVSGLALEPSQNPDEILSDFQDAEAIPEWARAKVAAATEAGLVVNRPDFDSNRLYPNEPATRAEVAAMIHQGLVEANRFSSISSEYIIEAP
ncbi:MAG: S-layer homology domain-containing protein [Cyanophyceae cyanobacterium]